MDIVQAWLNTLSQVAIGIGVLYGLWRMVQITREARAARELAVAASERAEAAAKLAASLVEAVVTKVDAVAETVDVVKHATNGLLATALAAKDAESVAKVGEANAVGEARGRAEQLAETEAKTP